MAILLAEGSSFSGITSSQIMKAMYLQSFFSAAKLVTILHEKYKIVFIL